MRIIAGKWRSTALAALGKGDAAAHLRPTSDRVRESLFSMLSSRDVIENALVLDLFAGTGALGLEAVSRGAQSVVFVENGRVGQRLISDNIQKVRAEDQAKLLRQDATKLGANPQSPFELVFLDPPYGKGLGQIALNKAVSGKWLADDATIVWEEATPMLAPEGFALLDQRKYGDTHVTVLSKTPA